MGLLFDRLLIIYWNHYKHKNLKKMQDKDNELVIFNVIEILINCHLFS
jgi:hypothetical protein